MELDSVVDVLEGVGSKGYRDMSSAVEERWAEAFGRSSRIKVLTAVPWPIRRRKRVLRRPAGQATRCRAGTPEPLLLGQMDLTYPCLELTRDCLDIDESLSGVEHQAHELARLGLQDVAVEGEEDVRS